MKRTAVLAIMALTLSGFAQAATNLVTNGSFELGAGGIGSFVGWQATLGDATTFVDSSGQTGTHAGQASDGLWSAYFGSTADSGGAAIAQTLATAPGQRYVLSFDLANDNGGGVASNLFEATVGATQVWAITNASAQDYAHETIQFVASSTSTLLSFHAYNDLSYLQLDHVAVTAVPEPANAALALAGLVLLWSSAMVRQRNR